MTSVKCINDLPDEVLEEILLLLPVADFIRCASSVCQRWSSVAKSSRRWTRGSVTVNSDNDLVVGLGKSAPHLHTLRIVKMNVTSAVYDNGTLDVLSPKCADVLRGIAQQHQDVECLGVSTFVRRVEDFISDIVLFRNLKSIELELCTETLPRGLLCSLADNCTHLSALDICRSGVFLEDLKYFLEKKKHCLTHLSVPLRVREGPVTFSLVGVCQSKLSSLTVCLWGRHLCAHSGQNFLQELRGLKTLQILEDTTMLENVGQTHVLESWLVEAFERGAPCQLQKLTLDGFFVEDSIVAVVVFSCPFLQTLRLLNSRITEKGLTLLNQCKSLSVLHLNYNQMMGLGAIPECFTIKELSLRACYNLRERDLRQLLKLVQLVSLDLKGCVMGTLQPSDFFGVLPYLERFNGHIIGECRDFLSSHETCQDDQW